LAALVRRHPDAIHHLSENRRQADPDEREALEQLRDGDTSQAVAWYRSNDRIRAIPNRAECLQRAADAWASDVAAGHDAALLAWRRANVAELNALARDWMDVTGRLSGPELTTPDGLAYRAGDRVVALAPDRPTGLVTSQTGTIHSVDPESQEVLVGLEDGRQVTLTGDQLSADRLGHGYATTVHRSQGATVDRTHLYADGGGRELAYVGMSRARQTSTAYVVADDVDQASEDLGRDWASGRTPVWAIDTGLPDHHHVTDQTASQLTAQQRDSAVAIAYARKAAAARAAEIITRPKPPEELNAARDTLTQARTALADLATGTGSYQGTPIGYVHGQQRQAADTVDQLRWTAEHASEAETAATPPGNFPTPPIESALPANTSMPSSSPK
jgi:hypothetical protein